MKTFLMVLVSTIVTASLAQTKISGRVTDTSGEVLPLANVILSDSYDGATTGADGRFDFVTMETGLQTLIVSFNGYHAFRQQLTLTGTELYIVAALEDKFNQLDAVTISAGTITASDASRRTIFKALDIVTVAGATADIAGALNTLPGTQKVGESGRLFVRGGDSNEARTFIDGMLVLDAYGAAAPNTPSRGRFLPFMFKGTSFSTGGYSAEYGQALSSALVLDSKDEDKTTRTDIGILSVGADVAHTQAWQRGSAAAKFGYTNIRPYYGMISQRIDWHEAPVSWEGSGVFRQQVGKTGMVKLYGNLNHTSFSLYDHDIDNYTEKDLYNLTNDYRYVNASYKGQLNSNWLLRGGLSYTFLKNDTQTRSVPNRATENGVHAKVVAEGSITDRIEIKAGTETIHHNYTALVPPDSITMNRTKFSENISAFFAESDLYAGNNFVARIGLRAEYNDLNNKFGVDPRLSLAYKTGGASQVSLSYGLFRQSVKNEYLRANPDLSAERASHYILNYQVLRDRRTFRVEAYFKQYDDLAKFVDGNTDLKNDGNGYAKGIEVFWRDNQSLKNIDYWISYSYLDTERNYLAFPYSATPSFASKHNFSIVYKHFIQKLKSQAGITYSFASGRPFNDPNNDQFNNGLTPSYHDLSLNWSYLPTSWLIIHFSCTNLAGADNIFGYEYSDTKGANGLYNGRPIRQAANRFLFLGIFITLSKDKSVNQLPSL